MSDENLVKLFLGLNAQSIEATAQIARPNQAYYERRDLVWKQLEPRIKPVPATPTTPAPPEVKR